MKQRNSHNYLPRGRRFPSLLERRQFLAAMGAGGLFFTSPGAFAQALVLTPDQTEGPYYPDRLPLDQDNDLLVINDSITPAVGTVAWISGRVLDRNGSPVRNALVEIWMADNVGSYIHSQGALNGRRDSNFQGYGRFQTASSGEYVFRAIKPGLYPGRVRHAHMKVTIPGGTSLTTQLYIEGETAGNDGVLSGIRDAAQRASVVRPWTVIPGSAAGEVATTFDLVMGYTPSDTSAPARPTLVPSAAVTNGATLYEGAASGSWVTLFGDSLSQTTRTWGAGDFSGNLLPERLDGVSVTIDGRPAAVYYVSPKQLNVLAPEAAADGNVQVVVTNANGASAPVTVSLKRLMPGFFQYPHEHVAAVRTDGSVAAPAGLIDGLASTPARPGETLLLFGTGFGPTNPATTPGQVVAAPAPTASPVSVRIHNQAAAVAFAGLVSPGLYQFNVTVPDLPDGDYPVVAEVAGARTAKIARLRIERSATAAGARQPFPGEGSPALALIARLRAAAHRPARTAA